MLQCTTSFLVNLQKHLRKQYYLLNHVFMKKIFLLKQLTPILMIKFQQHHKFNWLILFYQFMIFHLQKQLKDQKSIGCQQLMQRIISSLMSKQTPIILVGNKLDKKQLEIDKEIEYVNVKTILKNIIKKYRQVQMGIECSAYYDRNVKKVLNCAQRAILYPLRPLYDSSKKQLTPKFKKAIKRIFRILDRDLDGRITDSQLQQLQQKVFHTQLNAEDIKVIKQIILRQLEEYNVQTINLTGFEALQKKCIEMLKIQVCWSILRHFKYNDELEITQVEDQFILDEKNGEYVQLTDNATKFLQNILLFCEKQVNNNNHSINQSGKNNNDKNEKLNSMRNQQISEPKQAIQYLFSCSPFIPLQQFKNPHINLQKFLLTWNLYSFINYKQCYKSLLYLGYELKLGDTFKKVRSKKNYSDLFKLKERKSFNLLFVMRSERGQSEQNQNQNKLNLLFKNGYKFQRNMDYLMRQTYLYDGKMLILLKINQKYLNDFLDNSNLYKRIDLVLQLGSKDKQREQLNMRKQKPSLKQLIQSRFYPHTMYRLISLDQQSQIQLPSLNLQSFPIQYKQQNWKGLFNQIIKTFQNFQLGYSQQKLQKLKKQNQKMNKVMAGVGLLTMVAVGFLIFNKNPLKIFNK